MSMKKIIIYLVLLCFGIISCDKGNSIPEDTNQSTEINTNEPETDKDDPSGNENDEVDNNENEGVDEGEGNEEDDFIGGGAEYYHSNSYIASFYKPISIKLLKYLDPCYHPKDYEGVLMVILDKYDEYSVRHQKENQDNYTKYLELCEYYGDTGYDTTFAYPCDPLLFPPTFLAEEVSKIDITCSEEYNGIPAGESLSSQFNFYTFSLYSFIKNGYAEKYDYSSIPAETILYDYVREMTLYFDLDHYFGTPIVSSLDEVRYEDLKIMGGHSLVTHPIICLLGMKTIPSTPQGEIELTIELNNGEILSAQESVLELI